MVSYGYKKHRWGCNVHKLIGGWSIQKDLLGILPLLIRRNILIQRLFLLAYSTAETTQLHICEERANETIWGMLSKNIQVSCNLKSLRKENFSPGWPAAGQKKIMTETTDDYSKGKGSVLNFTFQWLLESETK